MTGPEFDEDESETFRPVPHPDDRLWRHPSEVAATQAAHANAETVEVPKVDLVDTPESPRRSRKNTAIAIAAGIAVVGTAALTIGVLSAPRTTQVGAENTSALVGEAAQTGGTTDVAADIRAEGEGLLTTRVHNAVASSLPRIQAATSEGMREGSGFFVTDDGHIATSAGLLEGAEYVLAWTEDGQRWKATVIATDPVSDIAVIHIDSHDWPSASLGGAVVVRTGQYALALDHHDDAISVGEVTAVGGPHVTVHQPAAMPGSAIVDDTGTVIAMVTSDHSNNAATPAWILEQVTNDLLSSGRTTHTWLGVVVETTASATDMVQVAAVAPGSPADVAQIQPGDLIDSFNGDPTPDAASLYRAVQSTRPGDNVELSVTRDGSQHIIVATIAEIEN